MLAVGCAVEQPVDAGAALGAGQDGGSWATEAELAWLEKLGAWDARLRGSAVLLKADQMLPLERSGRCP